MASQAQIEANRRNSQKSTGPRTDAGKAASAQNATRSGIYADTLLIDGDDPAELETLARGYLDTCRPVGPREIAVVESLINSDWLLRRMRRVETQMWNAKFKWLRESRGDEFDEAHGLYTVYVNIEERVERIQRRITTLERLYHRRLAELERLQSQRPAADPEPDPVPSPEPPAPLEIGFVPSNPELPEAAASPARSAAPTPGPESPAPLAPPAIINPCLKMSSPVGRSSAPPPSLPSHTRV